MHAAFGSGPDPLDVGKAVEEIKKVDEVGRRGVGLGEAGYFGQFGVLGLNAGYRPVVFWGMVLFPSLW